MSTAIELLETSLAEALDALVGMVNQHCHEDDNGECDTGALSANAEAVDVLERHGRVEIVRGFGRMTIFGWKASGLGNEG